MGKSTISMAIFNSKLLIYQGVSFSFLYFLLSMISTYINYINHDFLMLSPDLCVAPPPLNYFWTLFNVESQKISSQKKNISSIK